MRLHKQVLSTIAAATMAFSPLGYAQSAKNSYIPDSTLTEVYSEDKIETRKAQEIEQRTAQQRDLQEKRRREVEEQISAHKFHIEQMKGRQEQAQRELDLLAVSLDDVNIKLTQVKEERGSFERAVDTNLDYLESQRKEFSDRQAALTQELLEIKQASKRSEKEIFEKGLEVEKFRAQVAKLETAVMENEAKRANLEADEMKVRTDWIQVKLAVAESVKKRDVSLAELEDAKKRDALARKDLANAQMELAKAEKNRIETGKRVNMEIARYEKGIADANRSRINKETDKIRMESEVARMKEVTSRMRDSHDEAVEAESVAASAAMKSTLALETARTDFTEQVESSDQSALRSEKERARQRGLASAEEANRMVSGGRVWTTKSDCKAYPVPASSGTPSGFFSSGKQLLASPSDKGWVKVIEGGGAAVYVESKCGKFE